ncbi:MAG: carboxypeptidase regulatory-like domain-containing protein [Solirubrobacterales bacterium]
MMHLFWDTSTDGYAVLITELEEDTLTLSVTTSATGAHSVSSAVNLNSHRQIVTTLDLGFEACRGEAALASGDTCTASAQPETAEQNPAPADAISTGGASPGIAEQQPAPTDGTPTGDITGEVSSASGGEPIEGLEVCALTSAEEFAGCSYTSDLGEYTISSLSEGSYKIAFYGAETCGEGGCVQQNYVTQYYDDKGSFAEAEGVSVTGTGTTSGIDAEMVEGGKITGQVTSASGGEPIEGIKVCAESTGDQPSASCADTDSTGEYTISGLSTGSYGVEFLIPPETGLDYAAQYYNGKISHSEAEPVSVTAGSATPGIDAELEPAAATVPENTELPQITGTPAVGDALNCSTGTWTGTPTPTYGYKWLRDGSAISGAASSIYDVQPADEGHTLFCEVTATNTLGSKAATSGGVAVPVSSSTGSSAGPSQGEGANQGGPRAREGSPDATIAGTSLKVGASGKFVVKIVCPPGEASCTGRITLRTEHAVANRKHRATVLTLASGSFTVTGGQSKKITLHLTAAGRKLLAHSHVLGARVTIVARDPTGATHTGQTIVTLRMSKAEQGKH